MKALSFLGAQISPVFIVTQLLIAVATTLFLFYIDEGAYTLRPVLNPGNTGILLAYLCSLFLAQGFLQLLMKRWAAPWRRISSSLLGIPLAFFLLFGIGAPLAILLTTLFS